MTLEEFNEKRKMFYIDLQTEKVVFPTSKHANVDHAKWMMEIGYPYRNTTRGYLLDNFIMLYTNDFEIPNVNADFLIYMFEYFQGIKWIGLGCHRGYPGQLWEPKLKITRGNPILGYTDTL